MILEKYSFGTGDRFAHSGKAQLHALIDMKKRGVNIVPVWNKSHREHQIIGTQPDSVRAEADNTVKELDWNDSYYVDADHIGLDSVELFLDSSDYFTLDVADFIGDKASPERIRDFLYRNKKYSGKMNLPGIEDTFKVTSELIESIAQKYLKAVVEAGKIYNYIKNRKGENNFITEVSMDETDEPQTPVELFFILSAIADEGIPIQTIAPKFSGRFNKGVDYVGDVSQFEEEFRQDVAVLSLAVEEFHLPNILKLSIHSGSDKYSIYGCMNRAIKDYDAGLHLKTAGTTWLEEITGLAIAGGNGLNIAKEIYSKSYRRIDELSAPYAEVIDIDRGNLPVPADVDNWSPSKFADTLKHNIECTDFNPDFRQLLHISYKVAAEMEDRFTDALDRYEDIVFNNVRENIYRHLENIFI